MFERLLTASGRPSTSTRSALVHVLIQRVRIFRRSGVAMAALRLAPRPVHAAMAPRVVERLPVPARKPGGVPYYDKDDGTQSQIDRHRWLRNQLARYPVVQFLGAAAWLSDQHVATGSSLYAGTLARLVERAREGQSMAWTATSKQGELMRQWSVAAVALSLLKVWPALSEPQREACSAWLNARMIQVIKFHEGRGPAARNNNFCWANLAAAAVGHLVADASMIALARDGLSWSLAEVDDGFLRAAVRCTIMTSLAHRWP